MNEESIKQRIIREATEGVAEEQEEALTVPTPLAPFIPKHLDQIFREQGLLKQIENEELSGKAKRSKRYYIRQRIEQGKPYIPAKVRALGKKRAKELGYRDWERRASVKGEEEETAETIESVNKLSVIVRLIAKTRLGTYLERARNGNL
ncbi:hypothetical protein LCGC14_0729730 [marine sediment metagenome]|uniref:Uncharacterized protein n=1 Tax=marine sediment metagenome TaxID=412755 RepID=A0A0F9SVB5_9ZZZZ